MAGRIPKPWFRSSRGEWFVIIRGTRHPLGADKAEAFRKFHELMSGKEPPRGGGGGVGGAVPTLAEVLNRYFIGVGRRVKPATIYATRHYLGRVD